MEGKKLLIKVTSKVRILPKGRRSKECYRYNPAFHIGPRRSLRFSYFPGMSVQMEKDTEPRTNLSLSDCVVFAVALVILITISLLLS